MADEQWVIEFRNGGFLQLLDDSNSGPEKSARKFGSKAEAEAFMDNNQWIWFNGAMAIRAKDTMRDIQSRIDDGGYDFTDAQIDWLFARVKSLEDAQKEHKERWQKLCGSDERHRRDVNKLRRSNKKLRLWCRRAAEAMRQRRVTKEWPALAMVAERLIALADEKEPK